MSRGSTYIICLPRHSNCAKCAINDKSKDRLVCDAELGKEGDRRNQVSVSLVHGGRPDAEMVEWFLFLYSANSLSDRHTVVLFKTKSLGDLDG